MSRTSAANTSIAPGMAATNLYPSSRLKHPVRATIASGTPERVVLHPTPSDAHVDEDKLFRATYDGSRSMAGYMLVRGQGELD